MRDIKFRLYEPDEKVMHYPEEFKEKFDNYFITISGKLKYYQNCYDGSFFTTNAILMQYTRIV